MLGALQDKKISFFILSLIGIVVTVVIICGWAILHVMQQDAKFQEVGYILQYNGTEYIQLIPVNEKGYNYIDQLLQNGYEMQGNPSGKWGDHYTLVRSETQ
jgi:hypothetical protein